MEQPEVIAPGTAIRIDLPDVIAGGAAVGNGLVRCAARAAGDSCPSRAVPLLEVKIEVSSRSRPNQTALVLAAGCAVVIVAIRLVVKVAGTRERPSVECAAGAGCGWPSS